MGHRIVVDLTEAEQLCFNCRAALGDGPKHRIHGYLLCGECADVVSLLRGHSWRVCLVCALAGEADDIDCADIQNFLDRPNTFVKQYDWEKCPVCDNADDLLYTPCGHVFCRSCWGGWEANSPGSAVKCPVCRVDIALALVPARPTFLFREYVEVASGNGLESPGAAAARGRLCGGPAAAGELVMQNDSGSGGHCHGERVDAVDHPS
ncbi:hypothetical protein V2A60_008716 [Cordyceps javanica]